jgi:type IV pilus assembly protein PilB
MATPNEPVPPKKPASAAPQGGPTSKPQGSGPAKPGAVPPKTGATPPKAGATPSKSGPGPGKGGAPGGPGGQAPAGKTPAKPSGKPTPPKKLSAKERMTGRKKLGTVLVDLGFLDDAQLWELLDEAKSTDLRVGEVAVNRGLITGEQLMQAMAEQHGLKIVNLLEIKPTPEALQIVPETMAGVYKVLPLSFKDKVLTIAVSDPANAGAADDLRNLLGISEVIVMLAPQALMTEVLSKCYQGKEESIVDLISEIDANPKLNKKRQAETSIDLADAMEMAEAAPVRKLINMVFLLAIKDKASDIHFEPFEDEYKMRYKADGVLYEMVPPPRHLANAIATRIKVMSNLDIAERRLPQDGRIELNIGGNPVDMRVSILPTMFGESIVVRVLDRTVVALDLNKLGMDQETMDGFREMIRKPNGIILVTGPTGSGKTTTLYSALSELNVISDKIITTEDPVEYEIDGIIQVPINPEIGITFANALRSILRQDPDIILVGEVRDLETAQIAVQASLTGHTVFSTLHTNDAPSTIIRMRDMGLEPFLITATLEGVLAQRLVRRICEDCRTEFEPSAEMLMELNLRPDEVRGRQFFYGKGCDRCNNSGYKGRMGLYEMIVMNDELRDLISQGVSTDDLRKACVRNGMRTLREAGLRAMFKGQTSLEEVVRETILEDA